MFKRIAVCASLLCVPLAAHAQPNRRRPVPGPPPGPPAVTGKGAAVDPQIDRVTPERGAVGSQFEIRGYHLSGANRVRLDKQEVPFQASPNRIVFTVPSGVTAGRRRVLVWFPGKVPMQVGTIVVSAAEPHIDGVEPRATGPGSRVVIHGVRLEDAEGVSVGGKEVPFRAFARRITFALPASLPLGEHAVVVRFPARDPVSAGTVVVQTAKPRIAEVDPPSAGPGARVAIRGVHLQSASGLTLGERPVEFRAFPRQLVFTVPEAPPGPAPLRVHFPGLPPATAGRFVVEGAQPMVRIIDPPAGAPGQRISIRGIRLESAQSVSIGRAQAEFKASPGVIEVTVPPSAAIGAQPVAVQFGGRPRADVVGKLWVEPAAPQIVALRPRVGRAGDRVVIAGRHLAGATGVSVGGKNAEHAIFSRQISISLPDGLAAGKHVVEVAFSGQPPVSAGTVEILGPAPVVRRMSPPAGPPGSPVFVRGDHLQDVSKVRVGRQEVPFKAGPRRVAFIMPPSLTAGVHRVSLDFPTRRGLIAGEFAVEPVAALPPKPLEDLPLDPAVSPRPRVSHRPVVSGYGPSQGPPGTTVVVRGRGFAQGTRVMYGEQLLTPLNLGPEVVEFSVPRGRGVATVGLSLPGSKRVLPVGSFEVTRRPVERRETIARQRELQERARRRWREHQQEVASMKAEERRAHYLRQLAERERTRAIRRREHLERIRARWEAVFLALPEVQAELELHAERKARLARMLWLAQLESREPLVVRVEMLIEREEQRHARRMDLLKEAFAKRADSPVKP